MSDWRRYTVMCGECGLSDIQIDDDCPRCLDKEDGRSKRDKEIDRAEYFMQQERDDRAMEEE